MHLASFAAVGTVVQAIAAQANGVIPHADAAIPVAGAFLLGLVAHRAGFRFHEADYKGVARHAATG